MDKVCYKPGDSDPSGGCAQCDPTKSQTAWSPSKDFSTCKDGVCLAGKCCTGCYSGGTSAPKCEAGTSTTACGIGGKPCTQCKTGENCNSGVCQTHPGLYIQEVHVGSDYVAVINKNATSFSLNGYTFFVDDARGDTSTYDLTFSLPNQTLAAGATLYICESTSACSGTGTWNLGSNMMYTLSGGGAGYLCKGTCSSTTVIDMMMYKGTSTSYSQTAKYSATFKTGPVSGLTGESTQSFLRQAYKGVYPNFVDTDWKVGNKTK
jgi:hypothetical protein